MTSLSNLTAVILLFLFQFGNYATAYLRNELMDEIGHTKCVRQCECHAKSIARQTCDWGALPEFPEAEDCIEALDKVPDIFFGTKTFQLPLDAVPKLCGACECGEIVHTIPELCSAIGNPSGCEKVTRPELLCMSVSMENQEWVDVPCLD